MPSYLALGRTDAEGNVPPSQRVNLGCVGVGGRAGAVIPALTSNGHAQVTAFCDVDFKAGAERNLKRFPKAKKFADFRTMLDEMGDDIDAVSVVTPDHTHFTAAMDAMCRGKHVYVEKPLTHSFRESDLLMQAEKKFKVITQMGNQGHTSAGALQFQHLVSKGIIHDIVKIDAWKSPSLWFMDAKKRINQYPGEMKAPDSLNWDLWCGPAKMMPYNRKYHPFDWRAFYLYGNGMLGDWGAHIIDFAHHWLKLGLPTHIKCHQMQDHNKVIFPLASKLSMHFPKRGDKLPACDLNWHDGIGWEPEIDEKYWDVNKDGSKKKPNPGGAGSLLHNKDGDYLVKRGSHGSPSQLYPRIKMRDFGEEMKAKGPKLGHEQSFIQACMGKGETSSPFSVGGELTQVLLLGVICQFLNEDLEFDPKTKQFKGNDKANKILAGPAPRKGWETFYKPV
ncbi:Gfo/Idh/MocA family oxidoreductase [Verrucomicrobiaceae bacterium N1E253]|uniref:Gfo/Idh/MocA family oxidoreductase n=1 Tax=Oceaniferula marina TaxID=2748318 RepID=A0A851GFR8_9BACT|nr:Gfo/Idh/MocA family oxidoreductase [Oceaniferula marina]NWK56246.1 Gfo/Idh/MocA family oxidoreductase [Oceaniferula marina]